MDAYVRAVTDFLKGKGILHHERELGDDLMYRCPFHHGENENFGINEATGKWNCFKCKKRGRSAGDLLEALGITNSGISRAEVYNFVDVRKEVLHAFEKDTVDFELERRIAKAPFFPVTCYPNESELALSYIKYRGLDPDLLTAMGVRYSPYGEYGRRIILPWYDEERSFVGFSARSIDNNDYTRKMLRPKDVKQQLFVYNPTGRGIKDSSIVVVEGEFSSLAVAHLGYHSCGIFGSYLHPAQINILLQASEVILALDGGAVGEHGAVQAYKKLSGFVPSLRVVSFPGEDDPADIFLRDPNELRFHIERRTEDVNLLTRVKTW